MDRHDYTKLRRRCAVYRARPQFVSKQVLILSLHTNPLETLERMPASSLPVVDGGLVV